MAEDPSDERQRAIFAALLASLLLWNLPFGAHAMYPFKLFATWLHEMSHGLAMFATGAGFSHLDIYADTSGLARAAGRVGPPGRAVIASAGYLGTSVAGGLFLVVGQTIRGARAVLAGLAIALALSAALFIQNSFGQLAIYIAAAVSLAAALLGHTLSLWVVNFVAAQACTHAILDIRVLFRPQMVINGKIVGASDAHTMAAVTFGDHTVWAVIWLVFSAFVFYLALRFIYLRQSAGHTSARGPLREPAGAAPTAAPRDENDCSDRRRNRG